MAQVFSISQTYNVFMESDSSHSSAVQDQEGYWLERHGARIRAMTAEEFRDFGKPNIRHLSAFCLPFALLATVGFAYGPGARPHPTE
jgi:hypothetical protein